MRGSRVLAHIFGEMVRFPLPRIGPCPTPLIGTCPSPPPVQSTAAHPAAVVIASLSVTAYVVLLVLFAQGKLGALHPNHAKFAWPFCFCSMVFGYAVFFDLGASTFELLPLPEGMPADEVMWACFTWLMPVTGFGLLLWSELAAFLFSRIGPGEYHHLRHPVMAVHATSLGYYLLQASSLSPPITDSFGRPFFPMRYVLWTDSVTCMIIAIYYVIRNTLVQAKALPAFAAELHRLLSIALFSVLGTFAFGGVGSADLGLPGILQLLLLLVSWASFYGMLFCISRMLRRGQQAAPPRVANQFLVIRGAVVLIWHLFPVVQLVENVLHAH